jgi:hypothetical protein
MTALVSLLQDRTGPGARRTENKEFQGRNWIPPLSSTACTGRSGAFRATSVFTVSTRRGNELTMASGSAVPHPCLPVPSSLEASGPVFRPVLWESKASTLIINKKILL